MPKNPIPQPPPQKNKIQPPATPPETQEASLEIEKMAVPEKAKPSALPKKTTDKKESTFSKIIIYLSKFATVPLKEKVFFAENLRVMIRAGLSIAEALETLAMQTKNKKFSGILYKIKDGIMEGNQLGSMLDRYPKVFPEYFRNMIRIGEVSGNLEKNLEELSLQMKKDHELLSKVRGAMIYPSVIVVATIGITILMFVYVIPSVLSIFEELEVELPLATRILIAISKLITNYGIFIGILFIATITALIILSRTKKGKKVTHFILLHLWIIGPIIKKINLARFSRTISALLKTDIPVIESFKIAASVLGNVYYKEACFDVSEKLAKGVNINSVLKKQPSLFPPLVTQMIFVGEKSGTLDLLLGELANFYEGEVSDITKNLSSIIEPILIVILGAGVALIAFAVISPIYTLTENI